VNAVVDQSPASFEMKNALRSKLSDPQAASAKRLTKSIARSPNIKTQKTPSATHVLKSQLQNSSIKTHYHEFACHLGTFEKSPTFSQRATPTSVAFAPQR
jgi:hypothetical protein